MGMLVAGGVEVQDAMGCKEYRELCPLITKVTPKA